MKLPELKQRVASGSKWAFLGELAAKLLTPAIFILLARLLTPVDFGIAAAAVMVMTFSQLLWEAGLGKAVIQREDNWAGAANVAFWSNVSLALAVYILVFLSAESLADMLGEGRIADVLRVQGLQMPIMALGSIHRALLQREFAFKKLFWIRLVAAGGPGLASIPLALSGWGYWALVAGSLAGSIFEMVALWRGSNWRPSTLGPDPPFRSVWAFGLPVMGEGLLLWGIAWGDAFIVSRYLGTAELGYYRGGGTIVSMLFALVLSPLMPMLFGALSRLQNDPDAFRTAFLRAVHAIALTALPLAVFLACLTDEIVITVLGSAWLPAASVIAILGVMQGLSWLVGANPDAYRAKGRPDINFKVNAINVCYYLPVLWLAAQADLLTFLFARLGVALVAFPLHAYLASRILQVRLGEIMHQLRWVVLAVALQIAMIVAAKSALPTGIAPIGVLVIAGLAGTFGLALGLWADRAFLRGLISVFIGRR